MPSNLPPQTSNYSVVDQLRKTLAQISLFELLHISSACKVVLNKALQESVVPRNIDENTFQSMVGNIAASKVEFTEQDVPIDRSMHNDPLDLEVLVHRRKVRRVLIDGGVGLNICTLNLIKALGYSHHHIDITKQITIKSYDDEEHPSKGVVTLYLEVGSVTTDITFQVLDRELGYNMLLGCSWIHAM